jgi:hypothetical protein
MDFPAESATSNRRLRLNRIRSKQTSGSLPRLPIGDYLQLFLYILFPPAVRVIKTHSSASLMCIAVVCDPLSNALLFNKAYVDALKGV